RTLERAQLLRHHQRRVTAERAKKQLALATAEGVVEAARPHPRRRDEIIHGRLVVAPPPKLVHRTLEHLIGIELPRPRHGHNLAERSLKNSYRTVNSSDPSRPRGPAGHGAAERVLTLVARARAGDTAPFEELGLGFVPINPLGKRRVRPDYSS